MTSSWHRKVTSIRCLPSLRDKLIPVLAAMQEGTGLSMEKTKQIFLTVALFAHGYASIIANNGLEYDEKQAAEHLERTWNGALLAATQEE